MRSCECDVKNTPLYMQSALRDKGQFGLSGEFFDSGFAFRSAAAIRLGFLIYQFFCVTGMKEAGTAIMGLMLPQATINIRSYASVEFTVIGFDDVDEPLSFAHRNSEQQS